VSAISAKMHTQMNTYNFVYELFKQKITEKTRIMFTLLHLSDHNHRELGHITKHDFRGNQALFHHICKYISSFAAFEIKGQCRNDRTKSVFGLRNTGFGFTIANTSVQ